MRKCLRREARSGLLLALGLLAAAIPSVKVSRTSPVDLLRKAASS